MDNKSENNVVSLEDFKKKREERFGLDQTYKKNEEIRERIDRIVSAIQRIDSLMKELREERGSNANQ